MLIGHIPARNPARRTHKLNQAVSINRDAKLKMAAAITSWKSQPG